MTTLSHAITRRTSETSGTTFEKVEKTPLKISFSDVFPPLVFLLSYSLLGLKCYPALLLVIFMFVNRWLKNRYDFLVMVLFYATSGRAFLSPTVIPIDQADPLLFVSLIALFVIRKNVLTKKVLLMIGGYIAIMLFFAMLSEETLSIQMLMMRQYATVITCLLPLLFFANREFDARKFFKSLLVFSLIICVFHVLDCVVFNGRVMVPASQQFEHNGESTIFDLDINLFSMVFPRIFNRGLLILMAAGYGVARYYKLSWGQWLIIIAGIAVTRTSTMAAGFFIPFILFQPNARKTAKYIIAGIVALAGLYIVDATTGNNMRIASMVNQFTILSEAQDDEDLAEFGTTRMAQIIPIYYALEDDGSLWKGFGFIHPSKSKNPKYQIHNDLVSDISQADDMPLLVENSQFNTIIHMGFVGLILQILFYILLYYVIRKYSPLAPYYLSCFIAVSLVGIGGTSGLHIVSGAATCGIALGIALLTAKGRPANHNLEHPEELSPKKFPAYSSDL